MVMGNYSIKQLEKLSGVKSHTIRIWEQRYGLLTPKRTDTNIRYYDDEQLKKLLNIAVLNNHGHKISKISDYSSQQLKEELAKLIDKQNDVRNEDGINGLIISMLNLDEGQFNRIINETSKRIGFLPTVHEVVYPFLYKVGVMWGLDEISPPQEHFLSNLIRHWIIAETAQINVKKKNGKKIALFLPENELHDVGLLLANYELRIMGYEVIYLGQATPFEHIKDVVNITNPDYLLTFFIKYAPIESIQEQIDQLASEFPKCHVFVSGLVEVFNKLTFPTNVTWLEKPSDLKKCLTIN